MKYVCLLPQGTRYLLSIALNYDCCFKHAKKNHKRITSITKPFIFCFSWRHKFRYKKEYKIIKKVPSSKNFSLACPVRSLRISLYSLALACTEQACAERSRSIEWSLRSQWSNLLKWCVDFVSFPLGKVFVL